MRKIGEQLNLHPLVMEDILNIYQRPKVEEHEDHIFCVTKMISYNDTTNELDVEQLSLAFGANWVVTFQEREGHIFDPVRNRLSNPQGRLRKNGSDYLTYALLDTVVDRYFLVLEKIGERLEVLEDEMIQNPTIEQLQEIYRMKRDLLFLRKSIWPLRDMLSLLDRIDSNLIKDSTRIYLRDVYDHVAQIIDTVETYRDMASGILDTYLSSASNRMNEVMKILTIFAAIFIPLTFIAGIYGMNFEYMPELKNHYGYFGVWGVIIIVIAIMLTYFKKKKWF